MAVIGPSGSGKSSVVFAGLIAQLRQMDGELGGTPGNSGEFKDFPKYSSSFVIEDFRPGSDPFQGLAATLLPLLEPEMSITDQLVEVRRLTESLSQGELPLMDVVDRIVQKADEESGINSELRKPTESTRLLLVIDQFEELYTLCPNPETRYNFMDVLFEIIDLQQYQARPSFTLVFTCLFQYTDKNVFELRHDGFDFIYDYVFFFSFSANALNRSIRINPGLQSNTQMSCVWNYFPDLRPRFHNLCTMRTVGGTQIQDNAGQWSCEQIFG